LGIDIPKNPSDSVKEAVINLKEKIDADAEWCIGKCP
jgi:hypothetical protein